MRSFAAGIPFITLCSVSILLSACSTTNDYDYAYSGNGSNRYAYNSYIDTSARLPSQIETKGKVVVVDPNVHAWGAYENGELVKSGLATAGASWCPDIGRPCRTKTGRFHIQSLGSADCKSSKYPLPRGGAHMPYCMYFNGGQGLHGSSEVVDANISHGCVRMHTADAEWLRFNFVKVGTPVIVKSY